MQKQAKSDEISTKSREISTKSGYIWWDLARSDQTQQFLAKKNAYFRKNPVSSKNFSISGEIFQIPARISNFWRKFQIPAMLFFQISMPFFNFGNRSNPTDANHHRKPNRPIFPTVGFELLRPSTRCRRVESELGQKPTWPNPWTALQAINRKRQNKPNII